MENQDETVAHDGAWLRVYLDPSPLVMFPDEDRSVKKIHE